MSFDCTSPRTLELIFICDSDADPYDESNIECGEETGTICAYYMQIRTRAACVSDTAASNGLSTGSVLLILLLVAVVLYCGGGYVFNAMRNPDKDWGDTETNCPHLAFWRLLPKLVLAGCSVSYEYATTKLNRKKQRSDSLTSSLSNDVESNSEYERIA